MLVIGRKYDRNTLADLWGYKGPQAIARGVVTPAGKTEIYLFVTKEKPADATQYNDFIDSDLLFWEGEKKHGSDPAIINARRSGKKIFLFYRERHRSDFEYYGEVFLQNHQVNATVPSEFIFTIPAIRRESNAWEDVREILQIPEPESQNTEKLALIKARLGQGRFRRDQIKMWGRCSVTEAESIRILRASHIKPWAKSTNSERLNPYNGLLLIPNLGTLFNEGYISFRDQGQIIMSDLISSRDYQRLGVRDSMNLRHVYKENGVFLEYHRDMILRQPGSI